MGLVTGVIYFTGTLYWIARVMAVYGGLQMWVALIVNAALIAYLALFPGVFAVIFRYIVEAAGLEALWAAPLIWVTTELGRTYLLTGFPWVLLGYSQTRVLPIAQFASLFGVFGLSMLVTSVNAALAIAVVGRVRLRWAAPVTTVAIVLLLAVWGAQRVARSDLTREGQAVTVGLVQGNVNQAEKWDAVRAGAIFQEYLGLTERVIRDGAKMVLWPESSTPFFFEEDRGGAEEVRALARQAKVPILLGSDQIEHASPRKYFNAAFLVAADGSTGGVYRKMHLVPFGEYVPLKRLLFFISPLVEAVSDFSAGEQVTLVPVGSHRVSVAICYEIVYPALVRDFVDAGSEMLTTITNDAWFGTTSAPYQHFEQASMRAIEEGRYLVRSANTGISGIVDPYGHVLAQSAIFERTVLVGEARFLTSSTFYARHGDVMAYAAAVATVGLLVIALRARRTMVVSNQQSTIKQSTIDN
jgi:apolipoprotein N-acyltransferase